MTLRPFLPLVTALVLSLISLTASAAPKDAAATSKIDEAINTHYLATDFDRAESMLLGIVKACGTGCSPNIIGKAWMYVGIVRGCGKQDLAGAKEAFQSAKAADPTTGLDSALTTPEVQAEFEAVFGSGAASAANAPVPPPTPVPPTPTTNDVTAAVAAGTINCTPGGAAEIEVRRPIPVSCSVPPGAKKAVLAYKEFGGDGFKTLPMSLEQGTFRAPIPCSATQMQGTVQFTVTMKGADGGVVASLGSAEAPEIFTIVETTTQPPPAFPGQAPPARCSAEVECPPGMPGCSRKGGGGWGDSCTPAAPCKSGLWCDSGTCANAPTCESDGDCSSGRCSDGFCDMGDGEGGGTNSVKKFWAGLHFGADLLWVSAAKNVCSYSNISSRKYACYPAGSEQAIYRRGDIPGFDQPNHAPTGNGGEVQASGFVLATMRLMVSADYAITPAITVGARAGFAFRGGPPNVTYSGVNPTTGDPNASTGGKFLPIHAEGRGTYWIRSLGQPGLRPYVHVGGGVAQVDAKVVTTDVKLDDTQVSNEDGSTTTVPGAIVSYDVYKKVGQGFATLGGGVMYPLGSSAGLVANVNFMYMLPDSGIVLEPSLGVELGF